MKITDPDVIKNGEKDLIEAVKEDLDLEAVKKILKNQIEHTALLATGGQIIVHDNQVAFRLDFDLNLSGSLIFDRDGNYIPQSDDAAEPDKPEDILSEDLDIDDINTGDIKIDDITIDDALEELDPESDLLENSEEELPDDEENADETLPDLTQEEQDSDLPENSDDPDDQDGELSDEPDMDMSINNDMIDNDMEDILQESREFWESDKDS